ncbi:MAG: radical SAM protein [Halobacteriota archaeon]|nr:radical SAM protein [Halobacteriota archaeon]
MKREDQPMRHAGMAADGELQKRYYDDGKVFILQIESTLRCPQLCNYCYAGSLPNSPHGLSSEKIYELLESASKMEVMMIDWLGGDPLVREDWYDLCSYASELGLINNIWTSGMPLADREVAKRTVEVTEGGFISTHLDTLNNDPYKLLHGGEGCDGGTGNIKMILGGIENCLDYGKDPGSMVNCITYTRPLAKGDAKETISYFQENFGIKTCLTLFNPVIHRSSNSSWEPSQEEIKDAYDFRDRINYPNESSYGPMDVSKYYCGTVICVTGEGWVVPCSVIRTKEFGNFNDESLEVILEKGRNRLLYLDFRDPDKLPKNCRCCSNNINCFGCRSSAYYYGGDILATDPKCFNYEPLVKNEEVP